MIFTSLALELGTSVRARERDLVIIHELIKLG